MPDLIRHPETVEKTGFRLLPEYETVVYGQTQINSTRLRAYNVNIPLQFSLPQIQKKVYIETNKRDEGSP